MPDPLGLTILFLDCVFFLSTEKKSSLWNPFERFFFDSSWTLNNTKGVNDCLHTYWVNWAIDNYKLTSLNLWEVQQISLVLHEAVPKCSCHFCWDKVTTCCCWCGIRPSWPCCTVSHIWKLLEPPIPSDIVNELNTYASFHLAEILIDILFYKKDRELRHTIIICFTFIDANTVDNRVAIVSMHLSNLRVPSLLSPNRSSKASSLSVINPCSSRLPKTPLSPITLT
jgi:hypothetical protein